MNWNLAFKLSLLGLAMALATVSLIPPSAEGLIWLVLFIVCAVLIARSGATRPLLTGLGVGLLNSAWITAAHLAFKDAYLFHHPQEAAMLSKMPLPDSPRLMMLLTGPLIGLVTGLVMGGLAWSVRKLSRGRR